MLKAVFTQVSAKEGIRRWGDLAIAAIIKELRQLQEGAMPGKPVIEAIDPELLTDEDKKAYIGSGDCNQTKKVR